MSYVTADYSSIDPVLNRWAERHGVRWIRDDRGWDVRTLYWPLTTPESVQLWVAEPIEGRAVVHVCHNTTMGGQQHTQLSANISELDQILDASLKRAEALARELGRSA